MVDFLIIGQGLAGSVLALHLLARQQRVMVLGNSHAPSASNAAAGLYNPITGRTMTQTWMAETFFPYLEQFYQQAEYTLGQKLLYPMPIFRPFVGQEERLAWNQKAAAAPSSFVQDIIASPSCSVHQYGGLLLRQSGYLDVRSFVDTTRSHLRRIGAYQEGEVAAHAICIDQEGIHYEGIHAKRIIFCEGARATKNPLFGTLPFRPVKGEVIRVRLATPLYMVHNRGVFVIPQHGSEALVGATYDHHDLTWEPSEKGKRRIEERLADNFSLDYTVQDHWAGIRPATFDRRPLIGLHPEDNRVGIFNGLGTKGVSLAPYLGKALVDHWLDGKTLPDEVRLDRHIR